jgi:hypothetical protein
MRKLLLVSIAVAALSAPAGALAQAPAAAVQRTAPEIPSGWRFELQPFAFVPLSVSGDATVLDRQVPIDVSTSDIFDKLEMAATLRFEAWNGHWGLAADGLYTRLGVKRTVVSVPFDFTTRTFVGDALGAYRLGPVPLVNTEGGVMLDVFAGVRVVGLSQDLTIGEDKLSTDETAVKAVGNLRGVVRLSKVWAFGARAEMAGPDLEWFIVAGAEADVSTLVAIKLGWAFQHLSASSRRSEVDLFTQGPYLALGFRFGSGPIY